MSWWTRTWHNKGIPDEPLGDLLMNSPDGWVIDNPELSWLGSDQWVPMGPGGRALGMAIPEAVPVTAEGGLLPAISRATSLIVDSLSGVPWEVVRGRDTLPSPRWVSDPQLSRPDMRLTDWSAEGVSPLSPVSFWAEVIMSALWHGDGFVYCPQRDAAGSPMPPLFVLHPLLVDVVTPARTDSSRPQAGYWLQLSSSQWLRLTASEVIHVRGMGPYWNGRGKGAITGHMRSWDDAAAMRSYSTGLFTAGIPAGYLKTTAPNVTEPQAQALKDKWMSAHGYGPREIAVLNAVTDFVPIQMTPETAQLAESKRMATLDVANAFGVEPFMLGLPSDGSTYANLEHRMRHFAQFTLLPWARRIEGALAAELPQGTEVRLNLEGLTRADSATRVSYYTAGLAGGWLTADEIRRAEGLPALEPQAPPDPQPVEDPGDPAQEVAVTSGRTTPSQTGEDDGPG